jgi:DNA-binding GntR family transcriptional regulator
MIEGMAAANLNDQPFFEISLALLFRTAYSSDMTFTTSLSNEDFEMYELQDTHNDRTISRHRTLINAIKASRRHAARVARSNGATAYIPTRITLDGKPVDPDAYCDAVDHLDRIGFVCRLQS